MGQDAELSEIDIKNALRLLLIYPGNFYFYKFQGKHYFYKCLLMGYSLPNVIFEKFCTFIKMVENEKRFEKLFSTTALF